MSEQRCPVTDLIVKQCAHCQPAYRIPTGFGPTDTPFDSPDPRGPWFDAIYAGECNGVYGCGDEIREGDRIRSDGAGGWLCEGCGS